MPRQMTVAVFLSMEAVFFITHREPIFDKVFNYACMSLDPLMSFEH